MSARSRVEGKEKVFDKKKKKWVNEKIKPWKCKDGKIRYKLPNCKFCGKRSNTTDKETAQIAKRIGRICRECTHHSKMFPSTSEMDKDVEKIMFPKETIHSRIWRFFGWLK